jgi:hypothetical protein
MKTREAHTNPQGVKPPRVDIHTIVFLLYLDTKLLMRMLLPILAHMLWLSGMGTEPLGRRRPSYRPLWGDAGFQAAPL